MILWLAHPEYCSSTMKLALLLFVLIPATNSFPLNYYPSFLFPFLSFLCYLALRSHSPHKNCELDHVSPLFKILKRLPVTEPRIKFNPVPEPTIPYNIWPLVYYFSLSGDHFPPRSLSYCHTHTGFLCSNFLLRASVPETF